jgi:hypothetical protein
MVDKVYIVWCKLNKSTDKFDLGIFVNKQDAIDIIEYYQGTGRVWWKEYRLS